jgi:hypothetical protein
MVGSDPLRSKKRATGPLESQSGNANSMLDAGRIVGYSKKIGEKRPRKGSAMNWHVSGRFWVIIPYRHDPPSPYGDSILGYGDILGFVPFIGGGDFGMVPGPEFRSEAMFLNKTSPGE